MKRILTAVALVLQATVVWAAPPAVHITVQGSAGLVEIVPELAAEHGEVSGMRGCADGQATCAEGKQIAAIRAAAQPDETMFINISGDEPAAHVTITRGSNVVFDETNVILPFEFQLGAVMAGEKVAVSVATGEESVDRTAEVASAARMKARAVSNVSIYNYVEPVPGGPWYEVIEGSRTGGRFINGYTDRIQRGEQLHTLWLATGCSNHIGWNYAGSGRTIEKHQCFDSGYYFGDLKVSTNPNDDNMFAIADSYKVHIPIGTR